MRALAFLTMQGGGIYKRKRQISQSLSKAREEAILRKDVAVEEV